MSNEKEWVSRRGWVANLTHKGATFVIFAQTPSGIESAWNVLTEGNQSLDFDLIEKIEMHRVNRKMKDTIQKPKKPRAHNHIPASHREKPTLTQGISQDELAKAKAQAARFLSKMS